MFEARISRERAVPIAVHEALEPVRAVLYRLACFADAAIAPKHGLMPDLGVRYAAASPVARRRADAILHDAETIGTTGLRLIANRSGKADVATIAAARFLGSSLDTALRRLDEILPVATA
jgi:predicted cobalt transporter CbtA